MLAKLKEIQSLSSKGLSFSERETMNERRMSLYDSLCHSNLRCSLKLLSS